MCFWSREGVSDLGVPTVVCVGGVVAIGNHMPPLCVGHVQLTQFHCLLQVDECVSDE